MTSRRDFLRASAITVSATGFLFQPCQARESERRDHKPANGLAMGIAGYTFLNIPLEQCISMMQQVGVSALSIKDFYLPSEQLHRKK